MAFVYQHEQPNVPGKCIKGVLVEYGPGGYSPGHTHPKSAFICASVLEGPFAARSMTVLRPFVKLMFAVTSADGNRVFTTDQPRHRVVSPRYDP